MIAQHINEFSKNAYRYDDYTDIQKEVAQHLLASVTTNPQTILDLGCGSGAIYKQIPWKFTSFTGVDSAVKMCERHPKDLNVTILCDDFEAEDLASRLQPSYDLLISSSALQWAHDIQALIEKMAFTCKEGAFAVFTDKTFQTIYEMSHLPKFLPEAKQLRAVFEKHFTCKSEIKSYRLFFDDNLSLFRYIKKSGVSGGKKYLSVAQTKELIRNYPHDYLEFEVLFIWGTPAKA